MNQHDYPRLSARQIAFFLDNGYLRVEGCFTHQQAANFTSGIWTRLAIDPADKSTWTRERTHMPVHRHVEISEFAPKAWGAICDLLGGQDRVSPYTTTFNDAFIVNLGSKEWEGKAADPKRDLHDWHIDGDWFVHYLDSPEQGLLVVPLFSDIQENGGGTMICTDAIAKMARHLHDHPEGVLPNMDPLDLSDPLPPSEVGHTNFFIDIARSCYQFHELTGNAGDIIILHPLMLHSATKNTLRHIRIITNKVISLKAPFNFDGELSSDYSPVELKTLRDLGVDRLAGWKIRGKRKKIVPERERKQALMKMEEERRLKG